ncbi:MAG TPA: class I SAM-dependent methyltransferase [Candidatus Limnocylindrales bacterium]
MASRRALATGVLVAGVVAGAAAVVRRSPGGRAVAAGLARCSAPSAALYDRCWGAVLGGFYARVAREVAFATTALVEPSVLEVGCGPGRLGVAIARAVPSVRYTGLDLDPAMVERSVVRAGREGLVTRLRFVEGDVAELPFADGHFDLVVSTLSVHHWADAVRGFAEIRRVLRPDGRLLVHDVHPAWARVEARGPDLRRALAAGFGTPVEPEPVAWPGPLHLTVRVAATRPA